MVVEGHLERKGDVDKHGALDAANAKEVPVVRDGQRGGHLVPRQTLHTRAAVRLPGRRRTRAAAAHLTRRVRAHRRTRDAP